MSWEKYEEKLKTLMKICFNDYFSLLSNHTHTHNCEMNHLGGLERRRTEENLISMLIAR